MNKYIIFAELEPCQLCYSRENAKGKVTTNRNTKLQRHWLFLHRSVNKMCLNPNDCHCANDEHNLFSNFYRQWWQCIYKDDILGEWGILAVISIVILLFGRPSRNRLCTSCRTYISIKHGKCLEDEISLYFHYYFI